MMPIRILIAAFLLLPSVGAHAGSPPDTAANDDFRKAEWEWRARRIARQGEIEAAKIPSHLPVYDVYHYAIDVKLDPADSSLAGVVEVHARSLVDTLSKITLDLVQELPVDSVTGDAAGFVHADSLITVTLDKTYTSGESFMVRVVYGGQAVSFKGMGMNFRLHGDEPLIFSMGEPFFASYWWPCKDVPWDKADSSRVTIRVPATMTGVSNGVLVAVDSVTTPGWKSYEWITRHPIPPYLISVAATNYVRLEDSYVTKEGNVVPLENYVYPEDALFGESTFALLPGMMATAENLFGAYPFSDEKYGHAEVRGAGAMEHNTITSWGHALISPNRGGDDIVMHELAHQWWGDLVTCADWPDLWLNEGFATFVEGLRREAWFGGKSLSNFMRDLEESSFEAIYSPYIQRVPDLDSLFTAPYFRAVYHRGAWALHQLRRTVGDSLFFASLDRHMEDALARGGFADTEQFRASCEAVTGLDLDYFWDQWIYGTGGPTFIVDPYAGASGESLWVRLTQAHADSISPFIAPVDLRVFLADGNDTTITVRTSGAPADTFFFHLAAGAESLAYDPDEWLLDGGFFPFGEVDPDSVLVVDETNGVKLKWIVKNSFATGVNLYRAMSAAGPWEKMNRAPLAAAAGEYDAGAPSDYRYFRLRTLSDSLPGYESMPSAVVEAATPSEYALLFGDDTFAGSTNPYLLTSGEPYKIRFNLPVSGEVRIEIYSIAGRLVRTAYDGEFSAGFSRLVEWDGRNDSGDTVAPGIYFLKLVSGAFEASRKFVVLQ